MTALTKPVHAVTHLSTIPFGLSRILLDDVLDVADVGAVITLCRSVIA